MDFNDTAEEAAYRAKARAWLEANAPKRSGPSESGLEDPSNMDEARAWQRKKADAGYACITWPKEWGGVGGANWQAQVFNQEEARFPTPGTRFGARPGEKFGGTPVGMLGGICANSSRPDTASSRARRIVFILPMQLKFSVRASPAWGWLPPAWNWDFSGSSPRA